MEKELMFSRLILFAALGAAFFVAVSTATVWEAIVTDAWAALPEGGTE